MIEIVIWDLDGTLVWTDDAGRVCAYPDAADVLAALDDRGVEQVLSTGAKGFTAEAVLAEFGWTRHFSLILGSDSGQQKGSDHYDVVFNQFGSQEMDRYASVGDGEGDMHFAVAHDVATRIGITGGSPTSAVALRRGGATHLVASRLEALDILIAR